MARIWANRLEDPESTWKWSDVPVYRQNAVKSVLQADVDSGRISPERYREITGEPYEVI